jgi:hypothetical protein
MWKLKGCKRCGGDVFIDKDEFGWYKECLQCGHRAELPTIAEPRQQPVVVQKEPALAGAR